MNEFALTISDAEKPVVDDLQVNITRLATRVGYSTSHLSRVFAKKTAPSLKCARKLAAALKLSVEDLSLRIEEGRIRATQISRG